MKFSPLVMRSTTEPVQPGAVGFVGHLGGRGGLMKDAVELHYGKCRSFFESLTYARE